MRKWLVFLSVTLSFALQIASPGLAQQGKGIPSAPDTVILRVDGLACSFCAYGLEKKLKKMEGIQKLDIRLNDGIVILFVDAAFRLDSLNLAREITQAGFTLKAIQRKTKPEKVGLPQK